EPIETSAQFKVVIMQAIEIAAKWACGLDKVQAERRDWLPGKGLIARRHHSSLLRVPIFENGTLDILGKDRSRRLQIDDVGRIGRHYVRPSQQPEASFGVLPSHRQFDLAVQRALLDE